MQELDVVAGSRVALGFEVNEPELHLVEGLLQRHLLLLELCTRLALGIDVLLNLLHKCLSAPHLLHCCCRDVLRLRETSLELENLAINVGRVAKRGALALCKLLQTGLGLLQALLESPLLAKQEVALRRRFINR